MSLASGSGNRKDLLPTGSPAAKGPEFIILTTDAMATTSPRLISNRPSNPTPSGKRSLEALFKVTDSELQTLSEVTQSESTFTPITTQFVQVQVQPVDNTKRSSQKKMRYVCEFCGRVCAKPSVLQKHIRSHTNERPFPCQQCGFRFKTRSNLYKHQRSTSHQQRVPGSTETVSVSLDSLDESFETPEPDLSGNEEEQIIHDVDMAPLGSTSEFRASALTLVDHEGSQMRSMVRDDESVGVTVEFTRSDSLTRSSNLDRQTITTEMFSNRVDELISHNSKLLDKNVAPLQRRRLSRQNSDGRVVESPRIVLPSAVPSTPGSTRTLSRQNSSLDTPLEDSVFQLPIGAATPPVLRLSSLPAGSPGVQFFSQGPANQILISPTQNVKMASAGNVPVLISPTRHQPSVTLATDTKSALKEKLKGHLLSRRLQRLQREGSEERSVEPPVKRRLSRQMSMDTDGLMEMEPHETHDEVFVDDQVDVIVVDEEPSEKSLQIVQTSPMISDVTADKNLIIIPDVPQQLLLLPTNQSLQIFIPGEPSLAPNESGAWQNVNVVQSELSTPVVISMMEEAPDIDIQQLLLGHRYPSLRISTVTSFCTVLSLQPVYAVQSGRQVSMYSKWRLANSQSNPLGLSPKQYISLYKSSQSSNYSVAEIGKNVKTIESTETDRWAMPRMSSVIFNSSVKSSYKFVKSASIDDPTSSRKSGKHAELRRSLSEVPSKPKGVEVFPGCIRSDEMYQYVRGRGRGRYVCQQCGIRCRKPSLLKKHFRAHTDLRPYSCHACRFSFKTKGNLTKHMKSRYHSRKCHELGLLPVPTQVEDSQIDSLMLQQQMKRGASQDDEQEDEDEDEDEDEEAVAGLERHMSESGKYGRSLTMEESPKNSPSDESFAIVTDSRTPLLGDIMLGTDSRLSTIYGLSCDIVANETSLSESVSHCDQLQLSESNQSNPVTQHCQNEAAHSLLDLANDETRSVIGPNNTDILIRQESAPAGLIIIEQNGKSPKIPTRLGTMYASSPSKVQRATESPSKSGFIPPTIQLNDKQTPKALSLDMALINNHSRHRHPKIVEVSPGGDERTLLTSSPSPDIERRESPGIQATFMTASSSPLLTNINRNASQSTTSFTFTTSSTTSGRALTRGSSEGAKRQDKVRLTRSVSDQSTEFKVRATIASIPVAKTLPLVTGKSALPKDSQLWKSTQSVRELIRRLSSGEKVEDEKPESHSLAKRPRLAEILSEDSTSRESKEKRVEEDSAQPLLASPMPSPLMMPYVVLAPGQSSTPTPGSPVVLAQLPQNMGLLQPVLNTPSPLATVAPATPPVMILSPSIVLNQSGQFQLGGNQQFVFNPSPLVQPQPMFSSTVSMATDVAANENVSCEVVATETGPESPDVPVEMTPIPGKVSKDRIGDDGKFECQVCHKTFSHQHQLTLHKHIHAFERTERCEECNLSFRSLYMLQKHRRSELHLQKVQENQKYGQVSDENPRPFSCDECGVAFRIRGHLAKHLRSKQHLQRTEAEDKSDDVLSVTSSGDDTAVDVVPVSQLDVGARRRRFASESDSFRRQVDEDSDEFATVPSQALSRSMSTVAKSNIPTPATRSLSLDATKSDVSADGKFSSRVTLTTATVTMTTANVAMTTKTNLATGSVARQEIYVYQCALCNRQFSSLQVLEEHQCTGVPVVRNRVCDVCDAGFISQNALDQHKLVHQPKQGLPFACGICGEEFARLGSLNKHVTSRHGAPISRPWQQDPESVA